MRRLWLVGVLVAGALVGRKLATMIAQRAQAGHDGGPAAVPAPAPEGNPRAGVLAPVRDFVHEVRVGMRERESQIREAFAAGVSIEHSDEPDDAWRNRVLGQHA